MFLTCICTLSFDSYCRASEGQAPFQAEFWSRFLSKPNLDYEVLLVKVRFIGPLGNNRYPEKDEATSDAFHLNCFFSEIFICSLNITVWTRNSAI